MSQHEYPRVRRDLQFFPIRHDNEQVILVMDDLGLVEEGRAIPMPLYEFMVHLDGTKSIRDLQMLLMRQKGGLLVGADEVNRILEHLDQSFILDTEKYKAARQRVVEQFSSIKIRPCSHCGRSYPNHPKELEAMLEEILGRAEGARLWPDGRVKAIIAPHIDLSAGAGAYAKAYQCLKGQSPDRVIVIGVGHQMAGDLFCLTEKDFQTPLGIVRNDLGAVRRLREAGGAVISEDDFFFRAEHSVEFQMIFLQHLLEKDTFTIVPVLCGPLYGVLPSYTRQAYLETASPFLGALSKLVGDQEKETLVVVGVDFSHIGPKFGHDMPAEYLQRQSEAHDRKLLDALSAWDADAYWAESIRVEDQYNVCGFSAMACLLEILSPSKALVLEHGYWHEPPTRSAVSFAAAVFKAP